MTSSPSSFQTLITQQAAATSAPQSGLHYPYSHPTESDPPNPEGHDVLGIAQTGTGKRIVYLLPL